MREHNRNSDSPENRDPWDSYFYETGSTKPPKNHGTTIAVVLVTTIFLCGIASILSIFNLAIPIMKEQEPTQEMVSAISDSSLMTVTTIPIDSEAIQAEVPEETLSMHLQESPLSVENIPQTGGLSLQEIYSNVIDSVVSITCTLPGGHSSGTGVIFSEQGYIVTNAHVVENATAIEIRLTDERLLTATLVGADAVTDLAVLKVEADNLSPAQFGDSRVLRVGDAVTAIGDPLGFELRGTMTDGIVSAINRDITIDGRTMTLIQTNAALNSGNSGGPLLNCYGQVIGINTMKMGDYMNDAGVEGLGFAIPSTTIQEIVDQLIQQGYVSGRPDLGISGEAVPLFHQRYYRLPAGIYITEVRENTQAEEVGILPGDILLSMNDQRITDMTSLTSFLYNYHAGDTVEIVIYRSGRQYQLELTLGEATS